MGNHLREIETAIEGTETSDRSTLVRPQYYGLLVVLFAAVIFLSGIISPPSLMDDVDAAQGAMARNMLHSGDWVSARLDGVLFLDKAPLKYWITAILFKLLGVHDWVARIPSAVGVILLCWVVFLFGRWAFSAKTGFYAGLFLSTCIGLFLFTRILIPDAILTLSITMSIWAFLRALDDQERNPRLWAAVLAVSLATGVLLKSLIGIFFPIAASFFYLAFTRRIFDRETWRRLRPFSGLLIFLIIAAPWHILAILRNPPYFDFTMHGGPGQYHGFFWFYFINDQLLRFFNARYPRDYNTVPRLYFWLMQLLWLFPWSVYLPQLRRLNFKPVNREGQVRLMLLCWIGVVMVFFSFSTTQEYYSMPMYPAFALLLACGVAACSGSIRNGARVISVLAALAAIAICSILVAVRGIPTPGDISTVLLTKATQEYSLSMGHMQDLTIRSFAYLRLPLVVAGVAFLVGAIGAWRLRGERALLAMAVMMVLFLQAARLALVVFDPYMSSRPIADVLKRSPQGKLICYGAYYETSGLSFYVEGRSLMWNGRYYNLEYGSYAPGAPAVFIGDGDALPLWNKPERYYLATRDEYIPHILQVIPRERLHLVADIGGKSLFSNME